MRSPNVRFIPIAKESVLRTFNHFLVTYLPPETPCAKNPCGINAECRELNNAGSCTCIRNYYGDPYIACRPECMMNSECSMNKACIHTKCQDPCPGICGINAVCNVVNHSPNCVCEPGFRGNPFESCTRIESKRFIKIQKSSDHNPVLFKKFSVRSQS